MCPFVLQQRSTSDHIHKFPLILQMVLVLKKEVVKTNNAFEQDDTGKYRQLLVRTLHQCSVKFPDVAANIIPVVRPSLFFCRSCAVDVVNLFVKFFRQKKQCHNVDCALNDSRKVGTFAY